MLEIRLCVYTTSNAIKDVLEVDFGMIFRRILGQKINEKSIPKAKWKASALKRAFGSGLMRFKAAKRRRGSIGKGLKAANGGSRDGGSAAWRGLR